MNTLKDQSQYTPQTLWHSPPSASDNLRQDRISSFALVSAVFILLGSSAVFSAGGTGIYDGFFSWLDGLFTDSENNKTQTVSTAQTSPTTTSALVQQPEHQLAPPPEDTNKISAGSDNDEYEVNYISHDDFKELLARREYKHQQAALNTRADRTPDARQTPHDATDPSPRSNNPSNPTPAIISKSTPDQPPSQNNTAKEQSQQTAENKATQGHREAATTDTNNTPNQNTPSNANTAPDQITLDDDNITGESSVTAESDHQDKPQLASSEQNDSTTDEFSMASNDNELAGDTQANTPDRTTDTVNLTSSNETSQTLENRPIANPVTTPNDQAPHTIHSRVVDNQQDNEGQNTQTPDVIERQPVPLETILANDPERADLHSPTTLNPETDRTEIASQNSPIAEDQINPAENENPRLTNAAVTNTPVDIADGDQLARGSVTNDPNQRGGRSQTPTDTEERLPDNASNADTPRDLSTTENTENPTRNTENTADDQTVANAENTQISSDEISNNLIARGNPTTDNTTPGDPVNRNQPNSRTSQPRPEIVIDPRQPNPASSNSENRPTDASLSDREVDPTSNKAVGARVQAGRTLTLPGLKIKTTFPRFPGAAVNLPNFVTADLTFNPDGTVAKAKLTTPSGQPIIDSPLENSFYRWKAEGEALQSGRPFYLLQVRIDFGR